MANLHNLRQSSYNVSTCDKHLQIQGSASTITWQHLIVCCSSFTATCADLANTWDAALKLGKSS